MKVAFDGADDVIVITGGANGIGKALAIAGAQAGAQIIVCDIDRPAGEALAATDPRIDFRILDVADRDAVFAAFAAIERQQGRIDGLVCGAALQPRVDNSAMSPEQWRRVLDVNLNGVVWCYQAAAPGMCRRRRGSIIAFSSGLAQTGWPKASAYATTKAALGAFVRSVAKEVSPYRVRINLIAPGVIDTPQYRAANAGADDAHWQAATGVGQPEDVVGPLMFLLSDAATMTASLLSRDFVFAAQDG